MINTSTCKQNSGFTIIELMIAALIGLLLLAGAITLFINNKRIYSEHNQMARMQENARFAMQLLLNDIRMAGFHGCNTDINNVVNHITPVPTPDNLMSFAADILIEGAESASDWFPSGSNAPINMQAGTDGITVRYIQPLAIGLTGPSNASLIPTTNTGDINNNDIVAISDCDSTDIFQVTGLAGGLQHGGISKIYDTDSIISRLVAARYYISARNDADGDGNPDPALWRDILVNNSVQQQELIEGVENMQILYGVDNNADFYPDEFFSAANVSTGGWENIVSIKASLLFRTIEQNFNAERDTKSYNLLNQTIGAANDFRRRKVVNTTVSIRNSRS